MKKERGGSDGVLYFDKLLNVVKIIILAAVFVMTVIYVVSLVDARLDDIAHEGENFYIQGFGISAVILGIVQGITCGIAEIVTGIGAITAWRTRSRDKKKHIKHFLLMLIYPVVMFGVYLLSVWIIGKI